MKSGREPVWTLLALGLLLTVFSAPDAAASTYEAGVIDSNCTGASLGSSPASGSWTNLTAGVGLSNADAYALGGSLGGSANASSSGIYLSSNSAAACFKAQAVIDDIVISGPGIDVSTQVSAHLSGTLFTSTVGTPDSYSLAAASIRAETAGGAGLSSTRFFSTGGVQGTTNVDTTLTTTSFTAPVGVPFAIRMAIESEISVSDTSDDGSASASSDFASTMSFVEGSPVFALPPGYTANSADGKIVDNVFDSAAPAVPSMGDWGNAILVLLMAGIGAARMLGLGRATAA